MDEELAEAVRRHFGDDARLGAVEPLQGGASRVLHAFEVTADGTTHRLVIRRDPPGAGGEGDREREWEAMVAAHRHGVLAPEPLFRTSDGGIVVRFVEGESRPRRILAGARSGELLAQLAQQAARIHAVPGEELGWARPEFPPPEQALIGLEDELDRLDEPHPALELGIRWLWLNVPPNQPATLVHGDLRLGNVLVGANGLTAVLDWELAHLGDPAEDLAWLCLRSWRFGADDRPAAGLGRRAELLAAYREAGGREISLDELRFWEVYGNVRWGVLCVTQAVRARADGSFERSLVGRRACEAEWDLLAMIGAD